MKFSIETALILRDLSKNQFLGSIRILLVVGAFAFELMNYLLRECLYETHFYDLLALSRFESSISLYQRQLFVYNNRKQKLKRP